MFYLFVVGGKLSPSRRRKSEPFSSASIQFVSSGLHSIDESETEDAASLISESGEISTDAEIEEDTDADHDIDPDGDAEIAEDGSILRPSHPFYVVGIGASAGGLEALEQFFANMPNSSGMAFVVVQHLSPNYKSMMVQLLGKHTSMVIKKVCLLLIFIYRWKCLLFLR